MKLNTNPANRRINCPVILEFSCSREPIKISFLLFTLISLSCMDGFSQIHRIGGGLTFSSGTDFNYGETGNPGIVLKTWLALNKASTLHIVPSVTAYNRYKVETGYSILTNLITSFILSLVTPF